MAIYRCEAKIISRGSGHSSVAAAAYRTGTKIRDERSDKIHDYSSRQKGVVESVILRPDNSPEWTAKTDTLWNEVERSERRKDSQLAREFILAVPKELDAKQQFELAAGWAQKELVSKGMVAEISLHQPKRGDNYHVHILTTMRTIEGEKFSAKKPREWNDKGQLLEWRESWGKAVNEALEKAGRDERVDHRSLKDRGIDRLPEPKIGKEAVGMKERGVVADPERFKLWRWVKALNEVMPWSRSIEKSGEVQQHGVGKTWWERSLVLMSDAGDVVRDAVMDTWEKFADRHRGRRDDISPRDNEPDLSR
jgi:MobA/MobL family